MKIWNAIKISLCVLIDSNSALALFDGFLELCIIMLTKIPYAIWRYYTTKKMGDLNFGLSFSLCCLITWWRRHETIFSRY